MIAENTFGILGDSYSTFQGYIPKGNRVYYPRPEEVEDVLAVEQTWWHQLMQRRNMQMLVNDSYSGATVCENCREGYPPDSAFTARARRSFSAREDGKLQYIFLFGCTNDFWFGRTLGQLQYADWTQEDLQKILPAYCYILNFLKKENPQAHTVAIVNDVFNTELSGGMVRAAEHYGAIVVRLEGIDKQNGHPTVLGMRQIAQQVDAALDKI